MTRRMRPPELERDHRRDAIDPIVEGARYHHDRRPVHRAWARINLPVPRGSSRLRPLGNVTEEVQR
jgi:hypothetical protein